MDGEEARPAGPGVALECLEAGQGHAAGPGHELEQAGAPPHFTLVWLGMGADGHIASLFPNTEPQADDPESLRRLTPDPLPPEAPFDRITLTIPALVRCDAMMFVARGEEKRAVLDGAIAGEHDLPIARLLGAAQTGAVIFT